LKKVILNKTGYEKTLYLNPWIYKNEIKKIPKDIKDGSLIQLYSEKNEFLGVGYINTKSLITIRVLTFNRENIDKDFFRLKIRHAIKKRKKLNGITNSYRVVHSEADGLPGLIVDKYDNFLSVQFNTLGMYNLRGIIIEALIEEINPEGIYKKCDEKIAKIEGFECKEEEIYKNVLDELIIYENNIKFYASIKEGQKTGFFLDQRKNRKIVSEYVEEGFKVLDLFSNAGGFGIYSYKKGASCVDFVDISENACKSIEKNCYLNEIKNYNVYCEDAFDFLNKNTKKYNLIIIDPPPFAKTKREKEGAIKGLQYLVINSIKSLENETGYIALFSCSHHISLEDLNRVLLFSSLKTKKKIEIIEHLYQDIDHPYILNIPNSLYLKGYLIKVE
jgi:23S rRNA (cytosine1962-C5)-methyltransferase